MPKRSTFGIDVQLRNGGVRPLSSAGGAWVLYILLMTPGVFVSLHALSVYPPLDARSLMGFLLGVYLLPAILRILSIVRKRESDDLGWWRAVCICSAVTLVLLGALLFVNGGLDKSRPDEVRTTVIRKTVLRGRHGTQYDVSVSSWRAGRGLEHLNVVSGVYNRVVVGRTVTVELHKGFFGLPWRGSISPE